MNTILPITYPTITSYPGRANIYAISENNAQVIPWLMENYIQTESLYLQERMECDIDFYINPTILYRVNSALETQYIFNPYLSVMSIYAEFIGNDSIIEFIKSKISNGYYVSVDINTNFINAYNLQTLHAIFIYGYSSNEEFYIADFFKDGVYSFQTCTFKEMEDAIKLYDIQLKTWGGHPNDKSIISLIKINEAFNHDFNIHTFIDNIKEYANIKNEQQQIFRKTNRLISETPYRKFGNLHYNNLIEYIQSSIIMGKAIYNYRVFHILYEHKLAIRQRILYLISQGIQCQFLLPDMDYIIQETLLIRNFIIKESLLRRTNRLYILESKLKFLKEKEYSLLSDLVDYLS